MSFGETKKHYGNDTVLFMVIVKLDSADHANLRKTAFAQKMSVYSQ